MGRGAARRCHASPAARCRGWLLAGAGLLLAGGGGGFELKCFQGTGEIQPASVNQGTRAMTFPNQYWTQAWLDQYLSLPENDGLKTYDQFGFETGYSIGYDFARNQPPDEERFRALVVDGSSIPQDAVTIISYRQTMTWRMRLPSGNYDYLDDHVPSGADASRYANVVGPRGVSCDNLDDADDRLRCNSSPCQCNLQGGVWVCGGASGCAGHAVLRYMVTPLRPIESDNTAEDIKAYNDWLASATADMTVANTRFPIQANPEYPCQNIDLSDCYPAVEANVSVTYNGDKYPVTEGYAGTLFHQNWAEAFNLSIAAIDPTATMYPKHVSTCVSLFPSLLSLSLALSRPPFPSLCPPVPCVSRALLLCSVVLRHSNGGLFRSIYYRYRVVMTPVLPGLASSIIICLAATVSSRPVPSRQNSRCYRPHCDASCVERPHLWPPPWPGLSNGIPFSACVIG